MSGTQKWEAAGFGAATAASAGVLLVARPELAALLGAAAAGFVLLWIASVALSDASIVDVFWGPAVAGIGWLAAAAEGFPPGPRGGLALLLATAWGLRLGAHLAVRNAGRGEDFRYRAWRERAGGAFWWRSLFTVYLVQGVVAWVVASPLALVQGAAGRGAPGVLGVAGAAAAAAGIVVEAVADWQLLRFRRDPANAGELLTGGLWAWSRHPNYLGEAVTWWGLGLLALPAAGPLALVGPALITFSLLRVSGVTMLESALVGRYPGYADYLRSTPAFLPRVRRRPRGGSAAGGRDGSGSGEG